MVIWLSQYHSSKILFKFLSENAPANEVFYVLTFLFLKHSLIPKYPIV